MQILIGTPQVNEQYWQKYPFGGPSRRANLDMFMRLRTCEFIIGDYRSTAEYPPYAFEDISISAPPHSFRLESPKASSVSDIVSIFEEEPSFIWKSKALQAIFRHRNIKSVAVLGVGAGLE
ncbi:hypothetical protein H8F24_13665 [Synechococcus sp. CBW1002]|uniref:hypothetical protein n=1 Tax=Synechococcus sp. CBW1002 TaxID=1353134 RepID=UPI0018CFD287|nr:hypothetical protein [Synechococcus sp. CBW1002]QPN59123.1 hypothetical protein H8F24_13665 [Synechococcus sp. CBW1002]